MTQSLNEFQKAIIETQRVMKSKIEYFVYYHPERKTILQMCPAEDSAMEYPNFKVDYTEIKGLVDGSEDPNQYRVVVNGVTGTGKLVRKKKEKKPYRMADERSLIKIVETDQAHVLIKVTKDIVKIHATSDFFDYLTENNLDLTSMPQKKSIKVYECYAGDPHLRLGTYEIMVSDVLKNGAEFQRKYPGAQASYYTKKLFETYGVQYF